MVSKLDLTDEDLQVFEAEQLVKGMSHADDLVQLVVDEDYPSCARVWAAEKLVNMWKDGRQGGVTLDHLAYVGDHADEPHKSHANEIIRNNL
jgi:hypothetical protein